MHGGSLSDALRSAYATVTDRFAALRDAPPAERPVHLATLGALMDALGTAEEQVLFPAVLVAMNGVDVLVGSCAAEHRDLSGRLATLALHPTSRGFPAALNALARDVAEHQRDELESVLPVLVEAFGEDGANDLATIFNRQVAVD